MNLDQLSRQAGMWVETVQLFVQRGLLPGAAGCEGYGGEHLHVVRFIGRMQAEHSLPLDTIRDVLVDECEFDLGSAERILLALVEPDPRRAGPGPATIDAMMARAGASQEVMASLVHEGMIPDEGPYSGHHLWIVESIVELMASGLGLEQVLRLGRVGRDVADTEADVVVSELGRGTSPGMALASTDERRIAIGRLLSAVRRNASAQLMARVASAGNESQRLSLESVHEPSHLFLARHGLEQSIDRMRRDARTLLAKVGGKRASLGDTRPLVAYGRLLCALGRFGESVALLEEAVLHAAGKRDAGLWCYLSLSRAITGLTDDALSAAQKAVELAPQSPRAHAFYAATAAIVAARAGDLMLATAFIQEAMDSLQRSRKRHAEGLFRRMETLLARGRLMTVMCDDAEAQENGRKDLLEILELTSANQDAELGFDVRGTRDLFRVNAAFFLAMALLESDNREAATPWFEEVIALDPISPFGKAAYERLGQGYA